jgi:molybdopterin biosynthesis enzyme
LKSVIHIEILEFFKLRLSVVSSFVLYVLSNLLNKKEKKANLIELDLLKANEKKREEEQVVKFVLTYNKAKY